ncbi:MAG: ABC transporter substrate-binding protein [Anaerolineae bacterium]|jgi:peptide/nickel transport system substrate-binding protein|nr:ABC transporter substrate-binding protein [Anaerolineae bacterium]
MTHRTTLLLGELTVASARLLLVCRLGLARRTGLVGLASLWALLLTAPALTLAQDKATNAAPADQTTEYLVSPTPVGRPGGRLVISMRAEPRTLNPLAAVDAASKELLSLLHADLVHIHRPSQRTQAALARDWTVSADGLRYTLRLRRSLRFSDGAPLTADDVVFSFQALLDERTKAPARDLLRIQGRFPTIRKLDADTVELVLPAPYAPAERLFDSLAILPRHKLEATFREGKLLEAWNLTTAPASTAGAGPFRLKEYLPGQRIVLERNPYYWKRDGAGRALPYLDELVVLFMPDQEAEALRFRAGDIHLLSRVSARNFRSLQSGPGSPQRVMTDLGPGLEQHLLFFNLNDVEKRGLSGLRSKRVWMQDPRFRKAISQAIDRQALARLAYQGKATPIVHHVSPGNRLWHVAVGAAPVRNVAAAERELRAMGLVRKGEWLMDGNGSPVEFSIAVNAGNLEQQQMATLVQEDLRGLGIRVTVAPLEFRSLIDRVMRTLDYEAAMLALRDGDVDPTPQMPMLLSTGAMHFWRPGQAAAAFPWEAEIDRLMQAQNSTMDPARRRELYGRVQQLVATELPFIALVSPHTLVGAHRELGNLQPAVLAPHLLDGLDVIFWKNGNGRR